MKRDAICPVFGKCGGCLMQDIDYSAQLQIKKNSILLDFELKKIRLDPAMRIFCKDEYYYRNRMDFPFSFDGPGQRQKGRFDKIVNFEKCYIANGGVNAVFEEVSAWFRDKKGEIDVFDVVKRTGTIRYATIRSAYFSGESSVTFIFNSDSERLEEQKELIRVFAAAAKVKNVLLGFVKYNTDQSTVENAEIIKGNDILYEELGPRRFYFHTQGFFQSNSPVLLDIMYFVREKLGGSCGTLVDLYGGVGTLGISLMDQAERVYVVDNSRLNSICGKKNIEFNKGDNVRIFEADAEKSGELGLELDPANSVFLLDPPRNGIHRKVLSYIKSAGPAKLIYVSCNPSKQAQDIAALLEDYELVDFAAFDMFPQTKHVETVAVLVKKEGKLSL
jgi:23S rRNA (uracil1939-C5)-methyltransferase